jgi:hypothetical protein
MRSRGWQFFTREVIYFTLVVQTTFFLHRLWLNDRQCSKHLSLLNLWISWLIPSTFIPFRTPGVSCYYGLTKFYFYTILYIKTRFSAYITQPYRAVTNKEGILFFEALKKLCSKCGWSFHVILMMKNNVFWFVATIVVVQHSTFYWILHSDQGLSCVSFW